MGLIFLTVSVNFVRFKFRRNLEERHTVASLEEAALLRRINRTLLTTAPGAGGAHSSNSSSGTANGHAGRRSPVNSVPNGGTAATAAQHATHNGLNGAAAAVSSNTNGFIRSAPVAATNGDVRQTTAAPLTSSVSSGRYQQLQQLSGGTQQPNEDLYEQLQEASRDRQEVGQSRARVALCMCNPSLV